MLSHGECRVPGTVLETQDQARVGRTLFPSRRYTLVEDGGVAGIGQAGGQQALQFTGHPLPRPTLLPGTRRVFSCFGDQ